MSQLIQKVNNNNMLAQLSPILQDERPPRQQKNSNVQCYHYDFTLHNIEDISVFRMHEKLRPLCKKYVFQTERGDEGRLHYQGRLSLIKKRRGHELAALANDEVFTWYFTPTTNNALDSKACFYCLKVDTKVAGPWKDSDYEEPIFYTRQMQEFQRFDRYEWQKKVEQLAKTYDKRRIHWVYDPEGCKGKSDLCEWLDVNRIASVVPPVKDFVELSQICYDMPPAKAYLVDFPRAMKKDKMGEFYSGIEAMKNGLQFDKRYHFKKRYIDRPAVIVFSNTMPDMTMMSVDRWVVWKIIDMDLVVYKGSYEFPVCDAVGETEESDGRNAP